MKNWVNKLVNIMERLRGIEGCPWDREQTHESLKKYLIEEAYELVDAIDSEEDNQLVDELGDVLLQIIFHCQIGMEENRFDLQDVARSSCQKMIRRHPHVFGEQSAQDSSTVLKQWEHIKSSEQANKNRKSVLDGIPKFLPALPKAEKIQMKASRVGFDWDSSGDVLLKIEEELNELRKSLEEKDKNGIQEELGDLIFSIVNLCRFQEESPEKVLSRSIEKFSRRFKFIEEAVSRKGKNIQECSMTTLQDLWKKAKAQ